jgi:hypothetical protein
MSSNSENLFDYINSKFAFFIFLYFYPPYISGKIENKDEFKEVNVLYAESLLSVMEKK